MTPEEQQQRIEALESALAAAVEEYEQARDAAEQLQVVLAKMAARPVAPAVVDAPERLDDWVHDWLCPRTERATGTRYRWCPRWPEHPEALMRLETMHLDYVRALRDPKLGLAAFLRNSLDHHLPRLMAPDGPFAGCDRDRHEEPARLPTAPDLDIFQHARGLPATA